MPFSIASNNEQQVKVTVAPKTTAGKAAQIDGPVTVTVQVDGGATATPDPANPLSFTAVSGDSAGTTVFLVEGDTDLGAGVVTISDTVEYVVSGAAAANFGFTSDPPSDKP